MESKLSQHLPIGGHGDRPDADLIIGEVVLFHIDDELIEHGRIDPDKLAPVSRLAGTNYGKLGELFSIPRLSYEDYKQGKQVETATVQEKPTLEELCAQITEDNRHQEIDFGKPEGKEFRHSSNK